MLFRSQTEVQAQSKYAVVASVQRPNVCDAEFEASLTELRELAKTASLDEMMLAGLSHSIIFVVKKGHLVHPATVLARNEILLNQMKARKARAEAEAKKED